MIQAVIEDGIRPNDELVVALRYAAGASDVEVVEALIAAGGDVNLRDPKWGTPVLDAAERNRPDNLKVLLKAGAKYDVLKPREPFDSKHYKKTPLEIAIAEGHSEIVKLLKAAGARFPKKPKRPSRAGSVEESWQLIRKWFRTNARGCKVFQRKATPKQIGSAENNLGFKLPQPLRETYLLHNGSAQIFSLRG